MVAGLPAEEAIELYNTLARLAPSEVDAISQAEWRLRRLVKNQPANTKISIAYLQSLEMLGKAAEAIVEAERLWHLRGLMEGQELAIYLSQLGNLAMYEKAREVFDLVDARGAIGCLTNPLATKVNLAWSLGRAQEATALLRAESPDSLHEWIGFISKVEDAGLISHLPARQKIVQKLAFGRQCLTGIMLTVDDEGEVDFSHRVYVSASYQERVDLEEEIEKRLDEYFMGVGLGDSGHWDLIPEIVLPVVAAPAGS